MNLRYLLIFTACIYTTALPAQQAWHIEHYNSESGATNTIKKLEIDHNRYLWIASDAGLIRYDGQAFKFYNSANTPAIKNNRFVHIGLFKDSSIFAEDAGNDMYAFIKPGHLALVPGDSIASRLQFYLQYRKIYKIYEDCLARYHQNLIPENALPDYRLILRSVINSMVYLDGSFYYLNRKRQLFAVDTALKSFRQLEYAGELQRSMNTGIESTPVSLLTYENNIFLRWGAMIYKLNIPGKTTRVTGEPVLQVDSISNITCYAAMPDAGIVIIGTMANGLYIFRQQHFSTLTLNDKEANIFYAQQPYGNNGVLTKKGVLFPDKFIPFDASYTSESILRSKESRYYLERIINSDSGVIVQYNSKLEKVSSIPFKNFLIRCFNQLEDGAIWFAGDDGLGEIKNNTIELKPGPAGLPANFTISTFIQVGKQMLLAGGNNGLAMIDLSKNRATAFPALSNINVRTLYQGTGGIVLIGTYDKGFYALYKNRLIAFPPDADHHLASAHSFMEDANGFVWISTNNGLFQVSLKDMLDYANGKMQSLYYYYYDNTSGFLSNEFNGGCVPSGIKLADGKFSLPSMRGLVQFYPDSLKPILPVSGIYIDGIMADTNFIAGDSVIKISHEVKWLHVSVSSPYFGNRYNQHIEYNLQGLDDNWHHLDDDIITFSKLQTGDYTLRLRKKAGFGKDNYITQALSFSVEPAFYETLVFRVLLACCIAASGYLLYRIRLRYIIRQKDKLEKEVALRTKEQHLLIDNLESVITDLEQSKEELHQNLVFKEKLVRIISHDIQSPLRFLADIAQKLYEKARTNTVTDIKNLSWQLQKASGNIYHFVEDLSLWLTKMQKGLHVDHKWIDASALLQELLPLFTEQAAAKGNTIINDVEPGLYIYADCDLLKTILRNIIDNANKHTVKGSIFITIKSPENEAIITIRDTGFGIPAAILEKIQHMIKHEITGYNGNGSASGFGYMFIADFCSLLHIRIDIESRMDEGTVVYLKNIKAKKVVNEMYGNYE